MDEEKIRRELDVCLLSDEELEQYLARKELGVDSVPYDAPRFDVGQQVEAYTGDGWTKGKIVALHYREDEWDPSRVAPYQIELENGAFIFAPIDDDRVVRQAR